jgi:hypothetical protein
MHDSKLQLFSSYKLSVSRPYLHLDQETDNLYDKVRRTRYTRHLVHMKEIRQCGHLHVPVALLLYALDRGKLYYILYKIIFWFHRM